MELLWPLFNVVTLEQRQRLQPDFPFSPTLNWRLSFLVFSFVMITALQTRGLLRVIIGIMETSRRCLIELSFTFSFVWDWRVLQLWRLNVIAIISALTLQEVPTYKGHIQAGNGPSSSETRLPSVSH